MSVNLGNSVHCKIQLESQPVENLHNHEVPEFSKFDIDNIENGLIFGTQRVPEEIVIHILSLVEPKELLKCCLVCRLWNNSIKTYTFWSTIYKRKYNKPPKQLPWYLYYCLLTTNYFDTNLLQNGNGQENFENWEITTDENSWRVEDVPVEVDPLPINIPEFNEKTSCFVTSRSICYKEQKIRLGQNKLFKYILDYYKPQFYFSEWVASKLEIPSVYKMLCQFDGQKIYDGSFLQFGAENRISQSEDGHWTKIYLLLMDYPQHIDSLTFKHGSFPVNNCPGQYNFKMAGGVVKILFNSIKELVTEEQAHMNSKFYKIHFITNKTGIFESTLNCAACS